VTQEANVIVQLLLASAMGCLPPSDSSVAGFWESEGTSGGGIGHTIELKADGEILMSTTVMVDEVYRVRDGRLFVAMTAPDLAARTDGVPFSIIENVLVQGDAQGQVRKERLGTRPEASTALVGAWRYRHDTGAIAFERYAPDGRFLFRLPMSSDLGCYRTDGGSLGIAAAQVSNSMKYAVVDGKLVLRKADGEPHTYRRADPWYPRDQLDYQPPKTDEGR
jgi:hypothetical protein